MMDPIEKATHLIADFFQFTPAEEEFEYDYAKQCALIAVDEILKVAFYANDEIYNFYLEVKEELEKKNIT